MKGYPRVDGPKVPFYSPDFFFKDFVPESRLEFSLTEGCSSDTHGFLSST